MHDTVAVEIFLDLLRQRIDFLDFFRDLTGEQHRCLSVIQALALLALLR